MQSDIKNSGTRDEKDYQAIETYREEEWEFQFAWDKHATFLQAQSRAIKTLEGLIARYEALLLKDLETEEQKLRIETLKVQLDKLKNPNPEADLTGYIKALEATAEEAWSD